MLFVLTSGNIVLIKLLLIVGLFFILQWKLSTPMYNIYKFIYEKTKIEFDQSGYSVVLIFIVISIYIPNLALDYLTNKGYVEGLGPNFIPENIVINGRVTDPLTGRPLNNRLVILYLNKIEIARAKTKFNELILEKDKKEPSDGLFNFIVKNKYKVHIGDFQSNLNEKGIKQRLNNESQQGNISFKSISEDTNVFLSIPSKGAKYELKIIPGDIETLPIEFSQSGKTFLLDDNRISFNNPQNALGSNSISKIKYNIHKDTIILRMFRVPLNNCGGSGRIVQSYRQKQTYVHHLEKKIEGELNAGLPIPQFFNINLSTQLKAHYGFKEGETSEEELRYELLAEPRSNQDYIITWKEVWESGTAFFRQSNGQLLEVSFKVKASLIYEVNSISNDCLK